MTNQSHYTTEEWDLLVQAPMLAAAGAIMSDFTLSSVFKEMYEAKLFAKLSRDIYKDVELLQDIARYVKGKELIYFESAKQLYNSNSDEILSQITQIVSILNQKSPPDEAQKFKQCLYEMSDRVASASGEGFMGSGPLISDKEQQFLDKLREILTIEDSFPITIKS